MITQEIDCLAPSPAGTWERGSLAVRRDQACAAGTFAARRQGDGILLRHNLTGAHLSDGLVEATTTAVAAAGGGRDEFETAMVGLVRTTVDDPVEAWTTFYRNSLRHLADGSAAFAPVHERALRTATGSVLDLGSCFGFFPLRLAAADTTRSVHATDIHPDTVALLGMMATQLGMTLGTTACDAAALPFPDASFDTVTALHLLEHVDVQSGRRVVAEACRVARRRVIIAVPYEEHPAVCHGHMRTFDHAQLHYTGIELGYDFTVADHHGGWLTIDVG